MEEMTRRQRLMTASQKGSPDKIPFFHYWRHCQTGYAERESRNRGMGINWVRPPFVVEMHGVEIIEQKSVISGKPTIRRTYETPVGSVYEDERREPGVGYWHAMRSWKDVLPWQVDRFIKGPDDYKVMKYIVEHTEYKADYFPIEQAMDWLGEEGVVLDDLPHSPMQTLMIDWIGSEGGRCFFHLVDYTELVEDLYRALSRSRETMYKIAAKSPAPIALCGDNLDGFLVNPNLFRKYFVPEYEKEARILHEHGKLMAVHMDGRVNVLKEDIAQTSIDIVEAFHPPPMGDLPIAEALSCWRDKIIWVGFPASAYILGTTEVRDYAIRLLREMGTGERVAVAASTENLVSNENLIALTSVLEMASLPLDPSKVTAIEKRLTL